MGKLLKETFLMYPIAARPCEWPDARVVVMPVTDQWATVALTGQSARTVLRRLKPGCDLSNDAFPHLGFRETELLGSEARIYRVSFSGELTYEVNVPSEQGRRPVDRAA